MKKNLLLMFSLYFFLTTFFLLLTQKNVNNPVVLGDKIQIQKKDTDGEILQQVVNLYPNYRDGWLQMADYYYKNNNSEKAKECLQKALQIDPNNEAIAKLEKILSE